MLKVLFLFMPKKHQPKVLGSLQNVLASRVLNAQSAVSHICHCHETTYFSTCSSSVRTQDYQFDVSLLDFYSIAEATNPFISPECDGKTLKDLLMNVSYVAPNITRGLRRVPVFCPQDMLNLLLEVQREFEEDGVPKRQVESLWRIFRWINDQNFVHCPMSCEIMALMLLKQWMPREVQLLISSVEKQRILLDTRNLFCGLLEGYVNASDVDRAVLVYDQMRERTFSPNLLCYRGLINILVKVKRTTLAYRICAEMLGQEAIQSDSEAIVVGDVAMLLCKEGMIHEARNLIRKIMTKGLDPSKSVLDEIACGYCEKMDFEDLLRFVVESKCCLSVLSGNKIINSICRHSGVERGNLFRLNLERAGFRPNEITFGILIGWCCQETNLKSAFMYFTEMLRRGFKPDILSYNAILSGVFKEDLWQHTQSILDEMIESGIAPTIKTFKILIAGYCKTRKFNNVKLIVDEMVKRGLLSPSSLDDPLATAFALLGLDPLSVSLKRDNTVGLWKMEFFDNLGNGLYLETDIDELEKIILELFESSYLPNFDVLIKKECDLKNFQNAFVLIDQMLMWGQTISLEVFSALLKGFSTSSDYTNHFFDLIETMPKLSKQLDAETLNFLIKLYCKKSLIHEARAIYDQMQEQKLRVANDAQAALLLGFGKKGNRQDLDVLWSGAQYHKWTPKLSYFGSLVECLLRHRMLREAVELFRSLLTSDQLQWMQICNLLIEKLSSHGLTKAASVLVKQLQQHGFTLDAITYSHLINGFCKESNQPAAFALLDTMLSLNMIPSLDTSLALIPILCSGGEHEKAIVLVNAYLPEQSKAAVHNALIRALLPYRTEDAITLFRTMQLNGQSLDNVTHNMVLSSFCKSKNLRKFWEVLGLMRRKNIIISLATYRHCLALMCSQGKFNHAFNFMEHMLGECKSKSIIFCNILLYNLFLVGNTSRVNELLSTMRVKGVFLDEVAYNFLILGFSRCKDISSCEAHFSNMTSLGFRLRYWSLSRMVTMFCDLRESLKLEKLSRKMEATGCLHSSTVQNKIVDWLLSRNKFEEAENFLDRVAKKGLIPHTINYDYLIKRFCMCGQPIVAINLIDRMLKKGNVPDFTSYDCVVQSLCSLSQIDQAMNFHAEMLDRGMNPSLAVWDMLVQKLCKHGRTVEAEHLLMSMSRLGETPTSQMYSSVIDRYRLENNLKKVTSLIQMMQESGYQPDFAMHWSLINRLSYGNGSNRQGFLSRLLSGNPMPR